MRWWKETNVTDDDVTWLILQRLTGHTIVVAECQFEQFADSILKAHEALEAIVDLDDLHGNEMPECKCKVSTAMGNIAASAWRAS